jgi:ribosome assembly protein RRB1
MSKKRASSPVREPPLKKSQQPRTQAPDSDNDSAGEFEDRWEDEYESEDLIEGEDEDEDDQEVDDAGDGVDKMDLDGEQLEADEALPYLPQLGQGDKQLAEGEELVPDLSSYVMLHHARLAWPCLSFDVLRDVSFRRRHEILFLTFLNRPAALTG